MKTSPRFTATFSAVAVFMVVIGVVAAAIFSVARDSSPAVAETAKEARVGAATAGLSAKNTLASKAPSGSDIALGADRTSADPASDSVTNAVASKPAPITVTGCLERHDETFRLKDTSGVEAPKSRSWKSGFLKKGPAPIDVVDAANRLKLTSHVGQRVSVTGVLVDREMQVRSLQRVAASCS